MRIGEFHTTPKRTAIIQTLPNQTRRNGRLDIAIDNSLASNGDTNSNITDANTINNRPHTDFTLDLVAELDVSLVITGTNHRRRSRNRKH